MVAAQASGRGPQQLSEAELAMASTLLRLMASLGPQQPQQQPGTQTRTQSLPQQQLADQATPGPAAALGLIPGGPGQLDAPYGTPTTHHAAEVGQPRRGDTSLGGGGGSYRSMGDSIAIGEQLMHKVLAYQQGAQAGGPVNIQVPSDGGPISLAMLSALLAPQLAAAAAAAGNRDLPMAAGATREQLAPPHGPPGLHGPPGTHGPPPPGPHGSLPSSMRTTEDSVAVGAGLMQKALAYHPPSGGRPGQPAQQTEQGAAAEQRILAALQPQQQQQRGASAAAQAGQRVPEAQQSVAHFLQQQLIFGICIC